MRKIVMASFAGATIAAAVLAPGALAGPSTTVIYDNTPSSLPGNIPSWGFEATGTSELGDQVAFFGTARALSSVKVIMSSWACQTGHWSTGDCWSAQDAAASVPITLSIYNVGANGTDVGSLVTPPLTQTFNIPYRPSADPACAAAGVPGKWLASDGNCYNGYATPIVFNFPVGTNLPEQVIYGISYTTSHNNGPGAVPSVATDPGCGTTAGCFVDSLNVGLWTGPSVGSRPVGDGNYNYLNATSQYHATYCDNGFAGTDSFRLNSAATSPTGDCQGESPSSLHWFGYGGPAVQFNAVTPGPTCPTSSTTYTGANINGNLTVPAGQSYCLDHSTVTGDITVQKGASLTMINGSTGGHDVKGSNVASVTIDSSTVNHDVVFSGATGPISVTNSHVLHDLNLTGNKGSVTVSSNTIGHDLTVKNNTGGSTVTGNTVSHIGNCSGNTGFSGSGNSTPNAASCNTV